MDYNDKDELILVDKDNMKAKHFALCIFNRQHYRPAL